MSFDQKARAFVEDLFGVTAKNTKLEDLPDDYVPIRDIDEDDYNGFDLVKMIGKAVDPVTGIPRDIKIPEGDFPEAKNYFDFCENFMGPDSRFPFTRQMWICIHLLGEYCPHCSHPRWLDILKTPLNFDCRNLPDRVTFLNYGKCPKCKRTKAEMVANKELPLYTEMALCIGQRAGKSTMTASLSAYMTHKYLKYPKMSSVCEGIQASTPLTATFLGLRFADAYSLLWEPIIKNIDGSTWFCLAEGTAITLADGTTKPIENMTVGDSVKTLEGQSVVEHVFDNGLQECFDITLTNGVVLTGTESHQVRCLSDDGTSIIWKQIGDITESDFVLTD